MTRTLAAALAIASIGFGAQMASAASLDAQTMITGLNLIVLGDADASSVNHVEGTTYVGGNLNSSTIYANSRGMSDVAVGDATGSLIVGGDINANINGGGNGNIVVGGVVNGTNGSGLPTTTGATVPVAEMTALFTELSADLADFTDTAGATFSAAMNFQSFSSGTGGADGIAYLNLTQSEALAVMSNGGQLSFNIDAGVTSFIINVAGTDFTGANAIDIQINNAHPLVLFNFYEAEDLVTTSTWNASILAPGAAYFNGSGENGSIVVGSLTMGGEIRPYSPGNNVFSGVLPTTGVSAPVPVPAALPLAASGIAALGLLASRKRRRAA